MALQGSGEISFGEIRAEFGNGNNRLGQYRRDDSSFDNDNNGSLTNMPLDDGVPTSGEIRFGSFYNKQLNVVVNCHTGGTEYRVNARSKYNSGATSTGNSTGNWNVVGGYKDRPTNSSGTRVFINVNKSIGSAVNTNENYCALRTGSWDGTTDLSVDIGGSGKIIGAGGNGGDGKSKDHGGSEIHGGDGNSGLGVEYNGTTVNIANGGFISCGYGGGGGGGTGYNKDRGHPHRHGSGSGGGGGAGLPAGGGGEKTGTDGTGETGTDGTAGSLPVIGDNETGGRSGGGCYNDHWWEARGGLGGVGGPGGRQQYETGHPTAFDQTGEYESGPENGLSGQKNGNVGGNAGNNGAAIRRNSGITVNVDNQGTITGSTSATGVT